MSTKESRLNASRRAPNGGWLAGLALAAALALIAGIARFALPTRAGEDLPPVVIQRVMTANNAACYSLNGQYYDWLELKNTGSEGVLLKNWRLADDIDLRGGFVFPELMLPPGETLLVYCDQAPESAEDQLFTGFKLSSDGELLLLADAKERLVDTLVVPALDKSDVYQRDDATGEYAVVHYESELYDPGDSPNGVFTPGALRVNELMCQNHATLADADGDFSDWIELYNASPAAVNLAGWTLSDKGARLDRWAFPALTLQSGEYLIVFASGKDRRDPSGELHANFSLSESDKAVRLFDPQGDEVSRLGCLSAGRDVSVCRADDGEVTTEWAPTPGWANSPSGAPDELPALTQNAYGLYINEIANASEYGDWLELYNASGAPVDLSGMGLSDNPARPRKWQFPAGTALDAGGYLAVQLGAGAAAKGLSTDFALSVGETLCLSLPDGAIVDRVKLFTLPAGTTYGRAEGQARYRYFTEATPGARNAAQSYERQTAAVRFSVPGGAHGETALSVSLSSDPGAIIHYTTDGSAPDQSSPVYREPLSLTQNTVVRAAAFQDGRLPAPASAATYILGKKHDVYVVCVSGNYDELIGPNGTMNTGVKQHYDVYLEVYDPSGAQLVGQPCEFQVSGHNSRLHYAQKAFRVKAKASYGDSRFRAKLFSKRNYTDYKAFTVRASGQDNKQTHMRDALLTSLADATSVMYQESEVAVAYINGEYWGLYNMRERVTPESIAQFEGWDDPDEVVLLRHSDDTMTAEQGRSTAYKQLMAWVAETDFSTPENLAELEKYVDVDNYLDYVCLQIYISNQDLSNVKCYCNPAQGGRWRWIIYDLDLSYQVDRNSPRDWLIIGGAGTITQQDNTLFVKLMANPQVRDRFLTRFGELLATAFSSESVLARIQERYQKMQPEMPANCERWEWSVGTWTKAGNKIIAFAQDRPGKLITYFTESFQLTDGEVQTYFGAALEKINAAS